MNFDFAISIGFSRFLPFYPLLNFPRLFFIKSRQRTIMGGIFSRFMRWFQGTPDETNPTTGGLEDYYEELRQEKKAREKAEEEAEDAKRRAEEAKQREKEARKREDGAHQREKEADQREKEAREREAEALKREREARRAADQAQEEANRAKKGEESAKRKWEKEAKEKEEEARRLLEELRQAALDAQKRDAEYKARILEHQKRKAEARKAASDAQKAKEQLEKRLQAVELYVEKEIQPDFIPNEEEFKSAKNKIQYDPEKVYFAVCGSSGSGKSSLVNAFRGLKDDSPNAAHTGVVEDTRVALYPVPQQEMPYKRLVWFDCPSAGTLEFSRWQYFKQQGLFVFDVIILVYDTRFTQIDLSIIQNCERFKIPLFIVRSKADIHIPNIIKDLGYDESEDSYKKQHKRAQRLLIDQTKQNLKENLEKAGLAMRDIFIVSSAVVYSLVTNNKTTLPMVDGARFVESVLKAASERRYNTQAPAQSSSLAITSRGDDMIVTNPLLPMFKQVANETERFRRNMITGPPITLSEEHDDSDHEPNSHMPMQLALAHRSSEERYMIMG